MSHPANPLQVLLPFFPFLFVGMWLFVCFTISQMGWRSFAERYPAPTPPMGTVYTSPITTFGNPLARYSKVAQLIFTEEGIYFHAFFLFRAFHSPFLVPWRLVRDVEKKEGWLRRGYLVNIQDECGTIHVFLPPKVEDNLFRFYTLSQAS